MSLTAAQLKLRRTGLTATDMVVLSSGSDWHGRTVHDVWRNKVLGQDDFKPTEATELGTEIEPIVIRRAAAKIGLRTARGKTIAHPTLPRCLATPDAFTRCRHEPDSLLQAKVVGMHMARAWGEDGGGAEEIPETVFVQCAWELFVADRQLAYVGALLGTEVRTYKIVRAADGVDELVGGLRDIGDQFWTDYVAPKKPPPIDGSAGAARMLAAIWPKPKKPLVIAGEQAEGHARQYFKAGKAIKEAEGIRELAKQHLVELVADHEGMRGDGWRLFYRWRDPVDVPASTRNGYRRFDCRPVKGP